MSMAVGLPMIAFVVLYQWQPSLRRLRTQRSQRGPVGAYAGRARFKPAIADRLPAQLRRSVGRVAEFGFAGVAGPGDPFAGQQLYLEWCRDDVFMGFFIPEQDLEFLADSPDPNG